jgi:Mg2+-importing ATPase
VLELSYLNSFFETGLKSPLDEAILLHEHVDVARWKKIDEVPFDFERRRVSVLLADSAVRTLVVKGAPEDLLALSTHYETSCAPFVRIWDRAARDTAERQLKAIGNQGLRVLGIAVKQVGDDVDHAQVGDESELVFAGFAAFLDPPKASAAQALAALTASGIAVKIVTGDNELVTQHVCGELGIPVIGILSGTEVAQLNDHALRARVETVNVFCRMNPAQKNRIILAWSSRWLSWRRDQRRAGIAFGRREPVRQYRGGCGERSCRHHSAQTRSACAA